MTKVQKIRREYGESFRDVVKGFAQQGESIKGTARALEIEYKYFRRLLTRFGLLHHFRDRKDMKPECRGVGHPSHAERNRRRGPRIPDRELFEAVRKYPTWRRFDRESPYSPFTIKSRFGSFANALLLARQETR